MKVVTKLAHPKNKRNTGNCNPSEFAQYDFSKNKIKTDV